MKTNFKRFMALMLACLMVFGAFGSMATAIDQDECEHKWVEYGQNPVVEPTCEDKGYTWIICEYCNKRDIKDITNALGHDYQVEIDVDPTCRADGQYKETCTRCGDVKVDEVVTTNLNTIVDKDRSGDGDIITEVGCVCGEHETGHRFEWVQINDATCGEVAEYWLICTVEGGGNTLPNGAKICGFNYYGRENVECMGLGDVGEGVKYEVKGHDFTNYDNTKLTKEPTCSEYGILEVKCTNEGCEEVTEVKVAKLPHTIVNHEAKEPTCTAIGWDAYETCEKCDYTTYNELPMKDHAYEAVDTDATCTAGGYTTYTCPDCGDTYTDDETDLIPHNYEADVTAPTCTEDGYTTYTCTECGDSYVDDEVEATGHDWGEWDVTDANCETVGSRTRTCGECGATETETGALGNHVRPAAEYVTKTVLKNSEDREQSQCVEIYTCTVCKQTITEEVDHRDMTYGEIQKYPTCEEEGVKADYCGECGYYKATFTEPTGHNYVETVVPPTCTEQGYSTFKCDNVDLNTDVVCGAELEKGNFVDATGHGTEDYTVVFNGKFPTCEEDADFTITCNACGDLIPAEVWKTWPNMQGWQAYGHEAMADDGDCTTPVVCKNGCGKVYVEAKTHNLNADTDCTVAVECSNEGCNYVERAAKDHTPGPVATCKADQICTECGAVLDEASPLKHPKDGKTSGIAITRWPTCTEGAAGTLFCHLCATQDQPIDWETMTEAEREDLADWIYELLNPEGHNLVSVEAQVPTCQQGGWNAYEYCTKCDYTTFEALGADADNHSALGYHKMSVKKVYDGVEMGWARTPSCYADGLVWYYCDACAAADTTGTYNGWTETVEGSIMDCHATIATYGIELTDMAIASTCTTEGSKFYKCTHTYDTVDVIKVPDVDENGFVTGYHFEYRDNTYSCDMVVEVKQAKEAHIPYGFEKISEATCEDPAAWKITCACGHEFTAEELAKDWPNIIFDGALGHDIQNHDAQAPTCENVGWNAYETCARCDYSTYVEIPAIGHIYTGVISEATCTTPITAVFDCNGCDKTYTETYGEALGHDKTAADATCENAAVCERCGTTVADALGHELVLENGVTVFYPNCKDAGYVKAPCGRCDYVYEADLGPATGIHDYVITTPEGVSPCSKDYYETYTCSVCGDTYTDEGPAKSHTPYEWYWGKVCEDPAHCYAPTCTENGRGVGRLCTKCGECVNEDGVDHAVIETLGKGEHNYVTYTEIADCTTIGFTYTICTWCGIGYGLDAEGYADGKIEIAEEGVRVGDGVITDYVPASGHDWKDCDESLGLDGGYKAPTCTEGGYKAQYCANCGEHRNEVPVDATGHKAPDHFVTDENGEAVLDANGNVQYYDEFVDCLNGCGEKVAAHTDAEGKNVYEKRYETKYHAVVTENGYECRKTTYVIGYCDACTYKTVENIYIELVAHEMVPDEAYNAANAATDITDGSYKEYCKNCAMCDCEDEGCGYETITTISARLNNKVEFSNEIYACDENGNALTPNGEEYGMIVNGGYMAVKIDISGNLSDEGEGLWGIYFDLVFDADKLEFVGAVDNNALSESYNVVGSTLRVASTYLNGQNLSINAIEDDYLTLIFAVKPSAYVYGSANIMAEQFHYENTQVLDKDNKAVAYSFLDLGETKIWMAGDLDENGTHFGLADLNMLMNLVVNNDPYDARADINGDGEVNALDFVALKNIIMNYGFENGDEVYEEALA